MRERQRKREGERDMNETELRLERKEMGSMEAHRPRK